MYTNRQHYLLLEAVMRYANLILIAISSLFRAQAVGEEVELSVDEIKIYHDFLLHYPMRLGDLIGMQPATGDFSRMSNGDKPLLASFHLLVPTQRDRKFPADIILLTSEEAVTRRIANAGLLVPTSRRTSATRPDGYVRTRLQLSEIAFDQAHQRAVLVFSATCGCKGGEGGIAVYRHTEHAWHLEKVIDTWEG